MPVHAPGLLVGGVNDRAFRVIGSATCTLTETDNGGAAAADGLFTDSAVTSDGKEATVTNFFSVPTLDEWTPTLTLKDFGDWTLGCHNGVSGAALGSALALENTDFQADRFTYTKNIYGEPYTWTFRVEDLYRTSNTSENQLVLVANQPLLPTFRGFVLTVLDPRPVPINDEPLRDNTTPRRFPFDEAVIDGNRATWEYDGMSWFAGSTRPITLGMERPRTTLDSIYIHYAGVTVDAPGGVDGFMNWDIALLATYGYRLNIPGEFPSIDPDKGEVLVTHAKLKEHPEHPGNTLRIRKVTYDSQGNNPTRGPWTAVSPGS